MGATQEGRVGKEGLEWAITSTTGMITHPDVLYLMTQKFILI